MDYPWYAKVEEDTLEQGDLIDRCPVLVPPSELVLPEQAKEGLEVNVDVQTFDVVVMSQSCDLVQEKLDLVLVCPLWTLDEIARTNFFFQGKRGKELIRQGNIPGYHMLAACEIEGFQRGITVVDFRRVYSVPFKFLKSLVTQRKPRIRLLPPYREHLSQAFARFFMRVGLPVDIPPFK